jgi:hypothetical protein
MAFQAPFDDSGFLTIPGRPTSPGLACGPLRRNRVDLAPRDVEGCILVAERAVPDDVGRILAAAGTVSISGAVLSHVSLLSREFGKPSIAFGKTAPVRLVSDAGAGLLAFDDVVGADRPALLDEGDIVIVDGDEGLVRVPGGVDHERRREVRAVHDRLSAYGKLPDDPNLLAALLASGVDPEGPALGYLLEAVLLHRIVPAGRSARGLIEALAADPRHARAVERRLGALRRRVQTKAAARCRREIASADAIEDLDDLDRALRRLEGELARDIAVFEDLGASPEALETELDPMQQAFERRRVVLRRRIAEEVDEALELPAEAMAPRLGALFRLLRRARAADLDAARVAELHERVAVRLAEERTRAGKHLVVALDPSAPRERELVGGKAAGLLEIHDLLPAGCIVPRGFVVTTSSYRLHLLGEIGDKLRQAVADGGDDAAVSRRARAALLAGGVPGEVREAVARAYHELGSARVAVRSSATIEDGPLSSLAGLFDTYLGVEGVRELIDRVRWSWASLWNARALSTLAVAGMSPLRAEQAVLVQAAVPTRAAGVLFTRDPSGRPDTMLVNATWGLGEAISQGEIPGDLYWIRRSTGEVVACETATSNRKIVLDPAGMGTLDVPLAPDESGRPALGADDLQRLADLARALETATGRAQDVEFGVAADGTLLLFQIRRVVPQRAL